MKKNVYSKSMRRVCFVMAVVLMATMITVPFIGIANGKKQLQESAAPARFMDVFYAYTTEEWDRAIAAAAESMKEEDGAIADRMRYDPVFFAGYWAAYADNTAKN